MSKNDTNYDDTEDLNPYDPEKAQRDFLYQIETMLERFIFESRWFLLPLFLGLIIALLMFSLHFMYLVFEFSWNIFNYEKNELLLMILTFVDKVLVGGLVIMVIIGGYENSVSRLNISDRQRKLSWLGKLDASSLKIKLSTAIVSISSVHLLKMFLETTKYTNTELAWTTGIHAVMVITALALMFGERIGGVKH